MVQNNVKIILQELLTLNFHTASDIIQSSEVNGSETIRSFERNVFKYVYSSDVYIVTGLTLQAYYSYENG